MKEKNKKLIVIVSSLILVISVSFAYFLASTLFSGDGSSISGTAATIGSSEIVVQGSLEFNDLDILPGHKNVSSIKVTATGDNELIPYNVIWDGTNSLNTPLNYTVYKTNSEIEVTASCNKVTGNLGSSKIYYEECSITNENQLGNIVASGTIGSGTSKVTLIPDEFITSSKEGTSIYYYVILEYPNLEESQNIDMGGSFNGEITIEENEVTSDITIAGIYIENNGEYVESTSIPSEGYTLNLDKSTCNNNASIGYDEENNRIYVSNLNTSGTECNLYYDEYNPNAAKEYILSHYDTVLTRNDFSTTVTNTTTGTIYKSLDESQYDNDGEVYYFAGNPTDNWVQFGGYWWRIIRINGNGSIRMIYQGTSANITGEGTQIGTSAFNENSNDNAYVGYMYGTPGSSTYEETHANTNDSTIKQRLDEWYANESGLIEYSEYLDGNTGFCGDREPSTIQTSMNGSGGTRTMTTYYGAYIRFMNSNKQPTFGCQNSSDLYTTSGSGERNGALQYPIGLISADEVAYAGSVWNTNNQGYYLYTNQEYWTMSPFWFDYANGWAYMFLVYSDGSLNSDWDDHVSNMWGIRPVINLKADVTITGSGTTNDPYQVE